MQTNIHNLPEPLVKALMVERRPVVPGRISVTSLIDSPLRRLLTMKHFDEITEDASDSMWSLLGKAVHHVIEKGNEDTETKIEAPAFGATLVGVIDYHKDGRVLDWKVTSTWSVIFAKDKDYELQLQVYGWLLQSIGHPVNDLSVYMILRDWQKRELLKNPDYPPIPFHRISFKPWQKNKIEVYIQERVSLHLSAEKIALEQTSSEIPEHLWCSPEERWTAPAKWAAKNVGKDRAVRVFDTEDECSKFVHGTKMYLEHRPGEDRKCSTYCSVNTWCPYFKEAL
jgi:hypothetical protein